MKKFLALVLALVMTFSLVTISAGAEDFTDADKVSYTEAVDVMTAAGVVGGYADGSFNPTAGLTRGAAAKIICNMILGPTTAEALVANDAPYSDVAVDNVFAGYIAYCANEGIISGYADGTFRPAAPLTGYAFMKMLLGALGYDAAIEGYTGANWSIQVAKRALAIGLDDGLKTAFSGAKSLTREEACLYAFNAMNTKMVKYDTKSTISVGDLVITQNSQAEETSKLFREKYFEDLTKLTSVRTEAGRPAHTWKWDRDTIGTYADTADYTFILDKAYASDDNALEIIRELADNDDLVWSYVTNEAGRTTQVTKLYVDGKNESGNDMTEVATYGNVVEVYVDKYDAITDVVAFTYELNQIAKVSTNLTKAQKEDGATCKIYFEGESGYVLDNEYVGFDKETYVADAYVLNCWNAEKGTDENEIIASVLPETVEGKVTAVKGTKVEIDGESYKDLTSDIAIDDEGTFYLNLAGQIILADTDSKSENYAYIYNVVVVDDDLNADGFLGDTTAKVYVVLPDGTKASYPAALELIDVESEEEVEPVAAVEEEAEQVLVFKGTEYDVIEVAAAFAEDGIEAGKLVAYTINKDGEFVIADEKDEIKTADSATINKTNAGFAEAATEFIFVYEDGAKVKTSVTTGYKNVNVEGALVWYVDDESNNDDFKTVYAFVIAENGSVANDADLAVVLDPEAKETKNADGDTVYTYSVAIGEDNDATLTFEDAQDFEYGDVIAYEMDGVYAVIDEDVDVLYDEVYDFAKGEYVDLDEDGQVNFDSKTEFYTITIEFKNEAAFEAWDVLNLESVEVAEGASFAFDDVVAYIIVDSVDNVAGEVYVYEFVY